MRSCHHLKVLHCSYDGAMNMAKDGQICMGCPLKNLAKCSSDALVFGQWDPPVKSYNQSHFWPDRTIVITMLNFKVVASPHLWVYNAENFCVSFLTKLHPFFTWEGGK